MKSKKIKEEHGHGDDYAVFGNYGEAITGLREIDGELWIGNGEYCTQVNFCPYCGKKADKQI